MPKKQKAKIKQKNKCPEKLIRTEAAKEIAEIDRSLQDQKYQLRCRAAIDLLTAKLNMINADLSRKKRHVAVSYTHLLYEADLTAGIYKGGVHLPQGTYTLTCKSGSGQVELTDSKNNIWVQYNFGDDYDNTEEEVSDFEVFPGCYVIVEDTLELHMTAENAQMNLTAIANPLTESKTVSDKFTVGKDVPAGVYDVKCVEGFGIFDYDVTVSAGSVSYTHLDVYKRQGQGIIGL